ncbi:unnamed protein product [Durusdinium trenchii]|uniref:Uncharacterized protein n=1 Tax=Durusdinium trenchii TaxID=1381693 RepID=A0ABP0S2M8_9DINO
MPHLSSWSPWPPRSPLWPAWPMGIATAAQAWSLLGQETAEWLHEEHARWYLSTALAVPVPRGLRVPRFLDCEGSAWDPSWTLFRQRLQEEPPGAALRAGRPVHPAAARLAQRFLWEWPPEAAEYGHQLFARRLARDLAPEQGSGTTGGRYDEDSAAQDGFMSDGAFKGFCLYGSRARPHPSPWYSSCRGLPRESRSRQRWRDCSWP